MENKVSIRGAGGGKGGGGGRAAVEARDSLRSIQIADVVDLICEGPVQGLSDGLRSVFINDTPLMNDDGTMNFNNVGIEWRYGDQIQEPFAGLLGVESETAVSVEVKYNQPVVRTITYGDADMVRVTVSIPQLTEQNTTNGDINGSAISFHIDIQNSGSGFQTRVSDTIQGKTTSKYQRSYVINFNGPGPWDVKVVRDSADSTSTAIQNKLFWDSYTSIVKATLTYPNSVMVHTRIDAQQFNSIPTRGYGMKGLIIKVPSNYDPINRTYAGFWDGTFKLAWSDNPAWCFYDLVTNERYGLGQFIDAGAIDKFLLYSIGQYCDQKVPNGYGGYESRFRCNLYLQSRAEAYQVVQNFASIFRAITYWGSGTIMPIQDRPADPIMLYTPANVVDGKFTYSGSSLKQRHTVALVAWSDPTDMYRQKIEYVQDEELVKQYGIVETNVTAFGCTSRGQAHRYGKWLLAVERYRDETVTFRVGLDSAGMYPGAIFQVANPVRAGKRMGGRIFDYALNEIVLDEPVTLDAGIAYTISVTMNDSTVNTYNVTNVAGTTDRVQIDRLVDKPIVDRAVFILSAENLQAESWTTIGVKDVGDNIYEISGLKYYEGLYDYVELDSKFVLPPVSALKVRPATPQNVSLITHAYLVSGTMVGLNGTLSWTGSAVRYRVRWRRVNGAWKEETTYDTSIELVGLTNDPFEFQVIAIGANGLESDAAELDTTPTLDVVNLPTPTGLALDGPFTLDHALFKWDRTDGAESYEIEIWAENLLRRSLNVGNTQQYEYGHLEMSQDGGPWRIITIKVRARGKFGSRSDWATLTVGNPQIGPLQGIDVQYGIKSIFFQCERPTDEDFVGIVIWVGTTPSFAPSAANKVYDGPDIFRAIYSLADGTKLEGGKTYYVRAAGYDNFGEDSLIVSNSFVVIPAKNAPDSATIQSDMIVDGAISIAKFAEGLAPVVLVDQLENPPTTFHDSWTVFNKADGKLYRWDGEQYVYKIGAGDLYADSVTAGTIAAGAVTAREIAAKAITADKLYVGSKSDALNADPSMQDPTAWVLDSNASFVKLTDGSVGNYAIRSAVGKPSTIYSKDELVIDPKKNYYLSAVARRSPLANGSLSFGVELKDASGAVIVDDNGSNFWPFAANAVLPTTAWTTYSDPINTAATMLFPSSARTMRLVAKLNQGTNVDGYVDLQDYRIQEILKGVLIEDGAISADKLAAGAITADNILANTITGEMIKTNTITGDKLAFQSITGDKIAAVTITGQNIGGGSITADKIDTRNLTVSDKFGNVLFGAGVNLNVAHITGLGNFAYLDSITAQNIGVYMQSAAITSAYIANLSVTSAHIQDLVVGTSKITPSAVTTGIGGVAPGNSGIAVNFPTSGNNVVVFAKIKVAPTGSVPSDAIIFVNILYNGTLLSQEVASFAAADGGQTVSLNTFTLHDPPAGTVAQYMAWGGTVYGAGGSGPQGVVQIYAVEFKR